MLLNQSASEFIIIEVLVLDCVSSLINNRVLVKSSAVTEGTMSNWLPDHSALNWNGVNRNGVNVIFTDKDPEETSTKIEPRVL